MGAGPASRFQPHGPLGPSMIINPAAFRWHDPTWPGVRMEGQVIYEMHIGTFTPEGSWKAAARELAALKELGITVIELMPVHDFSGNYGWGYDGVDYFAPTRLYGTPDDFRAFVDQAHGLELGVILDVVYNHAGPVGNFLKEFATAYFSDRYSTDWGEAFNFDGADSGPVREFFIANAGYWVEEFHLDGLRLDATQNIYDASERHILVDINERVRRAVGQRSTILIAENEPQETKLVRPVKEGGYGLDGLWNDDFHHSAVVALTKHNEAYYSDYLGKPQELISAAKHGYLYQGQHYLWQKQRRGHSTHGLSPSVFINYLQNHDQIANLGLGYRIHQVTDPGMYRAVTTLLLLSPQTPMLFQGQEFAATTPFVYFADHEPELAAKVKKGRLEFLSQFPSLASARMKQRLPDPTDPAVFESCRLDFSERERNQQAYDLHRDLLKVRRENPVFKIQRAGSIDGAVLGDEIFVLRFFAADGIDRLLLVNLGMDAHLSPVPEPLLAPPKRKAVAGFVVQRRSALRRFGRLTFGNSRRLVHSRERSVRPRTGCLMSPIVRKLAPLPLDAAESERSANREWLVTNGLGGYASATISGAMTRRYHGLLIAALAAPLGRMVMVSGLNEEICFSDGRVIELSPRYVGQDKITPSPSLVEFRLEMGLPIWRYQFDEWRLEKCLYFPYRQNTVHITYRWLACSAEVEIKLRPLIQFRAHEAPVNSKPDDPYLFTVWEDQYEVAAGALPPLRMLLHGREEFMIERRKIEHVLYPVEQERGYESTGELWTPGSFRVKCSRESEITFTASTESWEVVRALSPAEGLAAERERRDRLIASAHPKARVGVAAELVLAADQFIVTPAGRLVDATRAYASGDDMRTVIAGYHWFTDWGRDTMISLEGLTLTTNRFPEAAWILRTFGNTIRHGLIPNLFPERSREGLYHTADATLWFFHAIDRYLRATNDRWTLKLLLPKLIRIVESHVSGTLFGIGVDPQDGLLRQGEEGYQLTWMDAKVGDWVVTPRRGKAVEINALWYNALRLLQQWVAEEGHHELSQDLKNRAEQAMQSFNRRFWCADEGYLYDVVDGKDGNDSACRPNQLLAISLPHPVLDGSKWKPVLETVCRRLLTPVGLRSLAPGHPDYKAKYFGDLRARDAAYHQGTVWAWLIGPLIDAWLRVYPDDRAGAYALLQGFVPHLGEACVGSISEIFDAEDPLVPRGCIAQAWSVAEVLRCWVKTSP